MNAPGCLDTFDHNITLTNDTLNMTVLCRHVFTYLNNHTCLGKPCQKVSTNHKILRRNRSKELNL